MIECSSARVDDCVPSKMKASSLYPVAKGAARCHKARVL